jgi:hypothetical protein
MVHVNSGTALTPIPLGLKPVNFPAFFGTAEVVPFHKTIWEALYLLYRKGRAAQ